MINSIDVNYSSKKVITSSGCNNYNSIPMRGSDFERSCENDSFEQKNKTKKVVGITAGILSVAAIVLGSVCFHKGSKVLEGKNSSFYEKIEAGWKKLCGKDFKINKGEKQNSSESTKKNEKAVTENDNKGTKTDNVSKPDKKNVESTSEQKVNEVKNTKDNDKEAVLALSDKKVSECSPEEIKKYADVAYPDDPNLSRLFQECLKSNVYKNSNVQLGKSHTELNYFIDDLSKAMPKEYLASDLLYKPIKDVKVKDVISEEQLALLRDLDKQVRNSLGEPSSNIAEIDKLKNMGYLDFLKQWQESPNHVLNKEFLDMFAIDFSKLDTKKSILDINLEAYFG